MDQTEDSTAQENFKDISIILITSILFFLIFVAPQTSQ